MAVALVGALGVAGSTLLLGGTAYSSWTPTPSPLEGSAAAAAGTSCRTALGEPLRQSEQVLIAERRGDWTYVLFGSSHAEGACVLPNDVVDGQDLTGYRGDIMASYDPDVPSAPHTAPDGIVEVWSMVGTTDEGGVIWSNGYVGSDVVGVIVHTPGGSDVQASVSNGRFAAWWPVGDVTGDDPAMAAAWTFTVTLADGSTRESDG
ncbi:MAG: hypothetical protein R2731_12015 [Nocardioides sp.]